MLVVIAVVMAVMMVVSVVAAWREGRGRAGGGG